MSFNNSNIIFAQLPSVVLNCPSLNSNAKLVFTVIYEILKEKGVARHRNKTIAKRLGISEKTVSRSIQKLVKFGFLICQGNSFTRKFFLGAICKLAQHAYTKIKQKKKNLFSRDKRKGKTGRNDQHTKNLPTYINNGFSIAELQQIKWYKDNPHVKISAEDKYLFE